MLHRNPGQRYILAIAAFVLLALLSFAQTNGSPSRKESTGFRISGTVVSKIDGHPLDRVRVLLKDSKSQKDPDSFVTSEDGKFIFERVKASKYSLTGTKTGFVSAAYDQHDPYSTAIVTGAGVDTENLILKLSPQAIISGKVLDESSEPVRHATVTLYRNDHSEGVDQIHMFRSGQTDDLGAYEFTWVSPGTYFLSVRAQPWYALHPPSSANRANSEGNGETETNVDRSFDVTYPVTYYANATETDDATPIEVSGGEHLQFEMQMNPVPSLRLIYHMPGNWRSGFAAPQLEQTVFDNAIPVQASSAFSSSGVLEMTGIPAGRYNLRIRGQDSNTQINGIELSKDGQELDASRAEALGTVKVSVKMRDEPSIPPTLAIGFVQARMAMHGFRLIGAKGEVEMDEIPAGEYELRPLGGPKRYLVVGLTVEGADVKGDTISLPAGASATVKLTLAAGIDIQGLAKKAGKPFAGAMVVLVPKDSGGNAYRYRRDQSDLDGTFTLRGVPPGSYTLVAIENGWDLDWSRPEVIAQYVKHGRPVVVSQSAKGIQVNEAIEVQPK